MDYSDIIKQAHMTAHDYTLNCIEYIKELYKDKEAHKKYPEVLVAMINVCAFDYYTMTQVKMKEDTQITDYFKEDV